MSTAETVLNIIVPQLASKQGVEWDRQIRVVTETPLNGRIAVSRTVVRVNENEVDWSQPTAALDLAKAIVSHVVEFDTLAERERQRLVAEYTETMEKAYKRLYRLDPALAEQRRGELPSLIGE